MIPLAAAKRALQCRRGCTAALANGELFDIHKLMRYTDRRMLRATSEHAGLAPTPRIAVGNQLQRRELNAVRFRR